MIRSSFLYKFIFSILLSILPLLFITSTINASLLFLDGFQDNSIGPQWEIKGYTLEKSGSFGPYSQLSINEQNQEIQILGDDVLADNTLDGIPVGWFGKSLITNAKFGVHNNTIYTLDTKVKIVEGNQQFGSLLTLEFDDGNRITFNIGSISGLGNRSELIFEENNNLRCVGSPSDLENFSGCVFLPFNLQINQIYDLTIELNTETRITKGFINGNLVHTGTYKGVITDFKIGIGSIVRDPGDHVDARFDDFKLTEETTTEASLDIPDLKQYTSPWGPHEYDTASLWNPSNPTISRWGCALTSASMLLQYYGYLVNPDELNTWLNQNNGYTRNGGILWPSIFRYTKINSGGTKPLLEFSYHSPDDNFIAAELDAKRAPILKMQKANGNTHFIVAKGKKGADFNVNDPASNTNIVNLLSQAKIKWGSNVKIGTFNPSHSDGSYIVLLVNDTFSLKVISPSGEILSDDFYFKEGPMADPENPDSESGVETLNAFNLFKPQDGIYEVEVTGSGIYRLDSYFYDIDGNASIINTKDNLIDENISRTYRILFSGGGTSTLYNEYFFNLLDLLKTYDNQEIYKYGVYNHIFNQMTNANNHLLEGNTKITLRILYLLKVYINLNKYLTINPPFASNLSTEIDIITGKINSL